jgi:hypothetical protein
MPTALEIAQEMDQELKDKEITATLKTDSGEVHFGAEHKAQPGDSAVAPDDFMSDYEKGDDPDEVPGGTLARDDTPPEALTGIVGEQSLSRQLGLLPEQAVLKFKGTVPIHGDAEFKLGQRFQCTVECVVSADATKGKVEDGELVEPGKTQEATVLEARRV